MSTIGVTVVDQNLGLEATMVRVASQEELIHYSEHGWVKIHKFFSEEMIATATIKVDAFIGSTAVSLQGRDINHVGDEVNSIHRLQIDPWFDSILNSTEMLNFVQPFLQDVPVPRGSELFAKPAVTGLPSPPHQDNYLFCIVGGNALTVWVALDPAGKQNGGLSYYDKSHADGLVEHRKSFAPGTSQMVSEDVNLSSFPRITPNLARGDVLVHHSEIIHGSNSNTSPQNRRGWTMQYKAESAKYDENRKSQYELELNEQLASRERLKNASEA